MARQRLLHLCAVFNVETALLAGAGARDQARKLNGIVVQIHRDAGWTERELGLMSRLQAQVLRTRARAGATISTSRLVP